MRISDWSSDVCSSDLPLLAAAIVLPHGQRSVAWFSLAALVAIVVLWRIGTWYRQQHHAAAAKPKPVLTSGLPRRTVILAMIVLMMLVFSKYFYLSRITSYYTFYLMHRFGLRAQLAQLYLFAFLFAVAGGKIGGAHV